MRKGASVCDAVADVAAHQQPAVGSDVVAERQLGDVASVEGDQQLAEEAADRDAAVALVRREAVGVALRKVELLLPRCGRRRRCWSARRSRSPAASPSAPAPCSPRGMLLDEQDRHALGREAVHRVHRDAVAVRVDQLLVDPVAAALGQPVDVAARARRASSGASTRRSRTDRCRCRGSRSRCGSPGSAAACPGARASPTAGCSAASPGCWRIDGLDAGLGGKRLLLDAVEPVRPARQLDVVRDVRRSRTSSLGFTMKLVTYQPTSATPSSSRQRARRKRRATKARAPRRRYAGDERAQHQRAGHDQQSR